MIKLFHGTTMEGNHQIALLSQTIVDRCLRFKSSVSANPRGGASCVITFFGESRRLLL